MGVLFEFLIPSKGQLPDILSLAFVALTFWGCLAMYRAGYRIFALLALLAAFSLDILTLIALFTSHGQTVAAALAHYTGKLSTYLPPWIAVLGCFAAGTGIGALTRRMGDMVTGLVYGILFVAAQIVLFYLTYNAKLQIEKLQWGLQYSILLPPLLLISVLEKFPLKYITPPHELQAQVDEKYWIALSALIGCVLVCPLFVSMYIQYVIAYIGIYAIAVYGLNIITGLCGQSCATQWAMFGIGAYVAGILNAKLGYPVLAALPIAGLLGAAASLLLGGLSFLKTYHLGILTVIFAGIVMPLGEHFESLTGGANGMIVPERDFEVAYYSTIVLLVIAILFYEMLLRSRLGQKMASIREGQIQAFLPSYPLRALAFTFSGFFGGIAGALLAFTIGFINPGTFTTWGSTTFLYMLVIGAMGTRLGPLAAVAGIQLVEEFIFRKLDIILARVIVWPILAVCATYVYACYFRIRSWHEPKQNSLSRPDTARSSVLRQTGEQQEPTGT